MSGAELAVRRLGAVEAFMVARVVPAEGHQLTCSEAFAGYRAWCDSEGFAALREAEFTRTFEAVAREAGIPLRQRGSNLSFMDTALTTSGSGWSSGGG